MINISKRLRDKYNIQYLEEQIRVIQDIVHQDFPLECKGYKLKEVGVTRENDFIKQCRKLQEKAKQVPKSIKGLLAIVNFADKRRLLDKSQISVNGFQYNRNEIEYESTPYCRVNPGFWIIYSKKFNGEPSTRVCSETSESGW